jgi:hypothetical protein
VKYSASGEHLVEDERVQDRNAIPQHKQNHQLT